MSITLAQLKQQARERSNMEDSLFVTDSELVSYINSSIAELHDILVQAYGEDYFVKDVSFTATANQREYSLSTIITDNDFYKLKGIDAKLNGSDFFTLSPFNFNERNKYQNLGAWSIFGVESVRYRLVGSKLIFSRAPDQNTEVKVWYTPVATKLVSDSDTLDDLNQFSEYVIVDAAIKMLNKEESDVTVLMGQKLALKRRIEEAANNRDAGSSPTITDVYANNNEFYYTRS